MDSEKQMRTPEGCLLSNGRYHVSVTAAGTGQSRRHGHVVNRWLEDPVEDAHGQFIYLRDLGSLKLWSVGLQPRQNRAVRYQTSRSPGQFHIEHEAEGIVARLDIAVSPSDDVEVRRLSIQDRSGRRRRIEVTSYLEPVLTWQAADIGHPAFSKLFLQTEYLPGIGALLTERRPRGNDERWPCLFHLLAGADPLEWETDRFRFLGRGRTAANPQAFGAPLSGTVGNVLDPCCSLRTVVELADGGVGELTFVTGMAENRADALKACSRYRGVSAIEPVFVQAEALERKLWSEHELTEAQASKFQSLAIAMQYGNRSLRAGVPAATTAGDVHGLFGRFGIPRDRIQIVTCQGWEDPATAEALKARLYWGKKGLFTNLIVLSDSRAESPGGLDDRVFTINASGLKEVERSLMLGAASLVVRGHLPDCPGETSPQPVPTVLRLEEEGGSAPKPNTESLQYFNGYGGFSPDGTEYVIRLPRLGSSWKRPPLPWVNVVANEKAGFLVSESGAGCIWAGNSQANRLTPWSNEPVNDPHGEALYLRDESSGALWSPLPGPVPGPCDHEVRHGFGYTRFVSTCHMLRQEVLAFVPRRDALKIMLVQITNQSGEVKKLSFTAYQSLVLGSVPERPSQVVTTREPDGSLRAIHPAADGFRGGVVFSALALDGARVEASGFSCDRLAFLGRHGTPENPSALCPQSSLDGAVGAGLDPCFVQQRVFSLAPGQTAKCIVLLGQGKNAADSSALVSRYSKPAAAEAALEEVREFWRSFLGGIRVETPSPIFNLMVNGWLAYQTLSCRLWGRTAFYQSSGAYGYRDQLQDSGSLLQLDPGFARAQIRLHARHQFVEGDVLHWWHPEPIERGVRTRFSDDLLWLPLNTADYIRTTGDFGFLDVREPFLKAPLLASGQDEVYLAPEPAGEEANLYEHCCRAIERSLATGAHRLPLMGTGDWNDGMNRVGREGRGESVWMGFFLHHILGEFIPLCEKRRDDVRVRRYSEHRTMLNAALNDGGWDGEWYRRAYYDTGEPVGSAQSDECKIDALAQAWAVISKAAPLDRAASAMAAVSRDLISENDGLIRLLTPPLVNTMNDPGYIKGYVAGVRENGGQYTHAACWVVKAVAELGENNRALRLLEMLMPVGHALSAQAVDRYKVEPYVVAADIYGAPPHVGRGGWTWYTGSSGWMFRLAVESILGLRIEGGKRLTLRPCVPDAWPSFKVRWRATDGRAACEIAVHNPSGRAGKVVSGEVDGQPVKVTGGRLCIPFGQDCRFLHVRVTMG
jgi:cyclic beta-1,2-glucan synthetase